MRYDELVAHVESCARCVVDVATLTGNLCPAAAELAGLGGIPPIHECTTNSADPCDLCRRLDDLAETEGHAAGCDCAACARVGVRT